MDTQAVLVEGLVRQKLLLESDIERFRMLLAIIVGHLMNRLGEESLEITNEDIEALRTSNQTIKIVPDAENRSVRLIVKSEDKEDASDS